MSSSINVQKAVSSLNSYSASRSSASSTSTPDKLLEEGAETYRAKHAEYGANDRVFAATMDALFPSGLTIRGFDDWYRLHIFILKIVKMTRYATNFTRGGHLDSIHDDMVYAAMLESFDTEVKENEG